jgi:hypothetical protein
VAVITSGVSIGEGEGRGVAGNGVGNIAKGVSGTGVLTGCPGTPGRVWQAINNNRNGSSMVSFFIDELLYVWPKLNGGFFSSRTSFIKVITSNMESY